MNTRTLEALEEVIEALEAPNPLEEAERYTLPKKTLDSTVIGWLRGVVGTAAMKTAEQVGGVLSKARGIVWMADSTEAAGTAGFLVTITFAAETDRKDLPPSFNLVVKLALEIDHKNDLTIRVETSAGGTPERATKTLLGASAPNLIVRETAALARKLATKTLKDLSPAFK